MDKNQLIGLSSAAAFLKMTAGRFAYYYYTKRVPEPKYIDNRPVWDKSQLKKWKPKRKNSK